MFVLQVGVAVDETTETHDIADLFYVFGCDTSPVCVPATWHIYKDASL